MRFTHLPMTEKYFFCYDILISYSDCQHILFDVFSAFQHSRLYAFHYHVDYALPFHGVPRSRFRARDHAYAYISLLLKISSSQLRRVTSMSPVMKIFLSTVRALLDCGARCCRLTPPPFESPDEEVRQRYHALRNTMPVKELLIGRFSIMLAGCKSPHGAMVKFASSTAFAQCHQLRLVIPPRPAANRA